MYKVKNCLTEDCLRPAFARGMCNTCYKFWQRHNPGLAKRPSVAERFWAKVNRLGEDDCWEWLASSQPHGYGQFAPGGRAGGMTTAHRVAYELTFGPIPEGLSIDHLCRNRGCVNPAHLEAWLGGRVVGVGEADEQLERRVEAGGDGPVVDGDRARRGRGPEGGVGGEQVVQVVD